MNCKTVALFALFASSLALGVSTPVSTAEAASASTCRNYANSAVRDYARSLQFRCGYFGSRWSPFWNAHYQWCRGVPRWKADSERRARRNMLRACY